MDEFLSTVPDTGAIGSSSLFFQGVGSPVTLVPNLKCRLRIRALLLPRAGERGREGGREKEWREEVDGGLLP